MTIPHKDMNDFRYLLNRSFDRTITEEEVVYLNRLISDYPSLENHYFEFINLQLFFRELKSIIEAENDKALPHMDEMLHQFSKWENVAPALKIEAAGKEEVAKEQVRTDHKVNRTLFAIAITSVAAFFILTAYVWLNPRVISEQVATLADSIEAHWTVPLQNGERLYDKAGNYDLRKGIVKIALDNGVIVNIEGPALFAFINYDKMKLYSGRLYAQVPAKAKGFIVETPSSSIIDLGTEFGITVENDGTSGVHMFKGKASLLPGPKGRTGDSEILLAGHAKRIDTTGQVQNIQLAEITFAREIDSRSHLVWRGQKKMDLANILGGGNGFDPVSHDVGIDPVSGQWVGYQQEDRYAENTYVRIPSNSYIDGVFVPDGTAKQIVTSRGDVFESCPVTSGFFYTDISNTPNVVIGGLPDNSDLAEKSCILLHANLGITFDLDAIRADFHGRKIIRFESQLRISEVAPRQPQADFWILIDGQLRYSRIDVMQKGDIDNVQIEFSEQDRFLTLIATEGEDTTPMKSIDSDWCVFAEPVLIFE